MTNGKGGPAVTAPDATAKLDELIVERNQLRAEVTVQAHKPLGPAAPEDQKVYDAMAANYAAQAGQEPAATVVTVCSEAKYGNGVAESLGVELLMETISAGAHLYAAPPDARAIIDTLANRVAGLSQLADFTQKSLEEGTARIAELLDERDALRARLAITSAPVGEGLKVVAWVRERSDGGIEGPIMDYDRRINDMRRKFWTGLVRQSDAARLVAERDARIATLENLLKAEKRSFDLVDRQIQTVEQERDTLRAQVAVLAEQSARLTTDHASEIKRIHTLYTCAACAEGPSSAARLATLTAALGKAREVLETAHTEMLGHDIQEGGEETIFGMRAVINESIPSDQMLVAQGGEEIARIVGMSPHVAAAADKTQWAAWEQWSERSLEEFARYLLAGIQTERNLLKAESDRPQAKLEIAKRALRVVLAQGFGTDCELYAKTALDEIK